MKVSDIDELMHQVAALGTSLGQAATIAQIDNHACQELYIALHKAKDALMLTEETTNETDESTDQTVDS